MSAIARVRNKQIDTGKIINILVQAENNAEEILFHIEGEPELVTDFASLAFYLLYTRPGDTVPSIVLLEDASVEDGVIKVPFVPTSYFTANDGTVKIQLLISDVAINLSVNEDGTIDGSTLWQTFPAFLFVAPSQLNATETIIEENVLTKYLSGVTTQALKTEGFAVGEQNGVAVGSGSEYYHNNAKYYNEQASGEAGDANRYANDSREWANGTRSDTIPVTHATDNAKYYATDAKNSAESASASAQIVSDHAEAIEAIAGDLDNIDSVASELTDIGAVADNISNVNAVAGNETNINAVNSNKTNIDTVAGAVSSVGTVATNISNVNAVAGNASNINTVAGKASEITTVAGKATEITTVAGKASEVTTVAGIATDVTKVATIDDDVSAVATIDTDVSAVAAVASDVTAVSGALSDIADVATDLNDQDSAIRNVASDMEGVSAVADDLANIDAVAGDLENIDNAEANALKAEGWANGTQNGTPVSSDSPYYENNAKYWADAVPDLKSAIRKDEARITNLEEKADPTGAYKTVNYRGTNAVPTGKAKYALVESIVGKSRAWNQLLNASNVTISSGTIGGATLTNNTDGSITLNGTTTGNDSKTLTGYVSITAGHKYLIFGAYSSNMRISVYANNSSVNVGLDEGSGLVFEAGTYTNMNIRLYFDCLASGQSFSNVKHYILIRDLTLIFPEGVPSTVAECVQKCPDLLKYDAYGTSIVDTTVEGVVSRLKNICDNDFLLLANGWTKDSDGIYYGNDMYLHTLTITDGIPNLSFDSDAVYTFSMKVKMVEAKDIYIGIVYTDGTNSSANSSSTSWSTISVTSTSGKRIARFVISYGQTSNCYIEYIQIERGSSATSYSPYGTLVTLTLPSSVTLRSAGTVADTDELNVEVNGVSRRRDTQRISGTPVDLGTLTTWTYSSGDTRFRAVLSSSLGIKIPTSVRTEAVIIPPYKCLSNGEPYGSIGDMCCYLGVEDNEIILFIHDSRYNGSDIVGGKATFLDRVPMIYPLATPVVTLLDPIDNNTILTEGGGTINTIQTQTPVIDNSMDVGYLAL